MGVGEGSGMRASWRGRWGRDEEGLSRTSFWGNTMIVVLVLERSLILVAE